MNYLQKRLFEIRDLNYKQFQSKLIPNIDKDYIIGVRIPVIRKFIKEEFTDEKAREFINNPKHKYYDENIVHSILISQINDIDECLFYLEQFCKYLDNWAVCDVIKPKIFAKYPKKTLDFINKCLKSKHTYTVRLGIVSMIYFYLSENFDEDHIYLVENIKSDEYYVNMAIAWYFSMALVKQYDKTIGIIENKSMEKFVHNKSIQKAIESHRVSKEKKEYLRKLRIK